MSNKAQERRGMGDQNTSVYRIPPHHYLHVLDQTTNVTRLEIGPQTFVRKDNEQVVTGPEKMVTVPPRHYCVVRNPVVRHPESREVQVDNLGQVQLEHAEDEVRLQQEPFPLYPGEELKQVVTLLQVVPALSALRLKVIRDFTNREVQARAGDEMLFEGPGTYVPRKEVEVVGEQKAIVIKPNTAIKLRALRETVDRNDQRRVAGEEWIVRNNGAYLPGVYEEVVETLKAQFLTEKIAVHVGANQTFTDGSGRKRKSGEEYLITVDQMETFIPDVYESVIGRVNITTLTNRQYCVILNPINPETGKPQLGAKKLVKGEVSFFLQPGEKLEKGIQEVFILGDNEGIVLKAQEGFTDQFVTPAVERKPGDTWMLKGPMEYIPPVQVEVVHKRRAIPLHENEGIYVRNTNTGQVRAVIGQTYMLKEDEELWEKNMPAIVKTLLSSERDTVADRGDFVNPYKEKKKKKDDDEEEDEEKEDGEEKEKEEKSPAEEVEDNEEYMKFWKEFNKAIKLGLYEDSSNRTKLAKLLRFQTTKSGDNWTSLEKYISRMGKGQKNIYYISAENKEAAEKSPYLERFKKKGIEVLYYTDPIDEYAMPQLTEFKGFQFMGANKENLKFDDDEVEEKKLKKLSETHKKLTDWLKETLGSKVEKAVVSNRLLETPAIIVSSQYGWSTNMERIMKAQTMGNADKSSSMTSQKTFEINPSHPLIRELKSRIEADDKDAEAADVANTLFDVALIGTGLTPADTTEFGARLQVLMRLGLGVSKDAPLEEPEVPEDEPEPEPEEKSEEKSEDAAEEPAAEEATKDDL